MPDISQYASSYMKRRLLLHAPCVTGSTLINGAWPFNDRFALKRYARGSLICHSCNKDDHSSSLFVSYCVAGNDEVYGT